MKTLLLNYLYFYLQDEKFEELWMSKAFPAQLNHDAPVCETVRSTRSFAVWESQHWAVRSSIKTQTPEVRLWNHGAPRIQTEISDSVLCCDWELRLAGGRKTASCITTESSGERQGGDLRPDPWEKIKGSYNPNRVVILETFVWLFFLFPHTTFDKTSRNHSSTAKQGSSEYKDTNN